MAPELSNSWPMVDADHVSVEQLIEILLWHTSSHLESCQQGPLPGRGSC